jgi:hypothetical protein
MANLILSSVLAREVRDLLAGRSHPDARSLFSLSLFIESLVFGNDLMLEVEPENEYDRILEPIADVLVGEFTYEIPPRSSEHLVVHGKVITRDGLIESTEHFLQYGLRRQTRGYDRAAFHWIKYYFFRAFEAGNSIVPNALHYPADLSVQAIIHSPAPLVSSLLHGLQTVGREEINRARILLGQRSTRLSLPYLLRFVLHHSASPDDILKFAINLRHQPAVRRFREWAYGLDLDLEEYGDLTDEEYESVLAVTAGDVTKELDFKPELLNLLQSVSIPAALAAGIGGGPSLNTTKLLATITDYMGKKRVNRNLSFIRALVKGVKSSRDIRSLVKKLWNVDWDEEQAVEFQELASMGGAEWRRAKDQYVKLLRKESKIDSVISDSAVIRQLIRLCFPKSVIYDALVKASSLDEFLNRLSSNDFDARLLWHGLEMPVAKDLDRVRRVFRLKTPLDWRKRELEELERILDDVEKKAIKGREG